jgi:hypothetical protein
VKTTLASAMVSVFTTLILVAYKDIFDEGWVWCWTELVLISFCPAHIVCMSAACHLPSGLIMSCLPLSNQRNVPGVSCWSF